MLDGCGILLECGFELLGNGWNWLVGLVVSESGCVEMMGVGVCVWYASVCFWSGGVLPPGIA